MNICENKGDGIMADNFKRTEMAQISKMAFEATRYRFNDRLAEIKANAWLRNNFMQAMQIKPM